MLDWWGPIIHEYHSGTEDIGSTFITPQEWLSHPGSVGRPVEECHIVGDNGEEMPPGQPGSCTSPAAGDSSTTMTPRRRRQ
jgi:fatty-acyl-CoA synthase